MKKLMLLFLILLTLSSNRLFAGNMEDSYFVNMVEYVNRENNGFTWNSAEEVTDWGFVINTFLANPKVNTNGVFTSITDNEAYWRGFTLFFPAGIYPFETTAYLYNPLDSCYKKALSRLSIIGCEIGALNGEGGGTVFTYAESFPEGGSLIVAGMSNETNNIVDPVAASLNGFVIENITFQNAIKIEESTSHNRPGVYGINAYNSQKSKIRNCTFNCVAYPINFFNLANDDPSNKDDGESYPDPLTIEEILILKSIKGIQLTQSDNSKLSKIYIYRSSPVAGQESEIGIYVKNSKGCFFSNILINTTTSTNAKCISLQRCSAIKMSGLYFEGNSGTIFDISKCNSISIDGSRVSYSYKRLLRANEATGCELVNHHNLNMNLDIDFDIELINSQFSIHNLTGNYQSQEEMSYKYKTISEDNNYANLIGNSAQYVDMPFIKLMNKASISGNSNDLFSVSHEGNIYTAGTINADGNISSESMLTSKIITDDVNTKKVTLYNGTRGDIEIAGNEATGDLTINNKNTATGAGDINFQSSGVDYMVIKNTGKVEVTGKDHPSLNIKSTNANGGLLTLGSSSGNASLINSDGNVIVQTGGVNYHIIDKNGSVGIGTGNNLPSAKLDVNGNIKASGNINSSSITTGDIITSTNSKVGIGKSVPDEELDVIGNIQATGTIQADGNIGANAIVINGETYVPTVITFKTGVTTSQTIKVLAKQ